MSDSKQPHEMLSALLDGEASEFEAHKVCKMIQSDTHLLETWRNYQRVSSVLNEGTKPFAHFDISSRVQEALNDEPSYSDSSGHADQLKVKAKGHLFQNLGIAASVALAVLLGVKLIPGSSDSSQVPTVAANDQTLNQDATLVSEVAAPAAITQMPVASNLATLASHGSSQSALVSQPQVIGLDAVRTQNRLADSNFVTKELSAMSAPKMSESDRLDDSSLSRFREYLLQHTEQSAMASGQGLMPFARVVNFGTEQEATDAQ